VEAETALFTRAFPFLFSMIDEVGISPVFQIDIDIAKNVMVKVA